MKSLPAVITHDFLVYFSDDVPRHQESARLLRENVDFTRYVVAVALQKIQQIADRGTCDGAEGADQKKIFAYISQLARSVQGR